MEWICLSFSIQSLSSVTDVADTSTFRCLESRWKKISSPNKKVVVKKKCFLSKWKNVGLLLTDGDSHSPLFCDVSLGHESRQNSSFPSLPFQMNNLASRLSIQVLQRSGLTSADLAQIWSLSDVARGWNKPRSGRAEWDWNPSYMDGLRFRGNVCGG